MTPRLFVLLLGLAAAPVAAQSVDLCDWQASAQALVEPWEDNTRTFANGAVRIAALDTTEPANASAYLLLLSPPRTLLGERQCRVVGWTEGLGFTALSFADLKADYDPARGLILTVPTRIYDPALDFSNAAVLTVVLNQSTGAIDASLELGRD